MNNQHTPDLLKGYSVVKRHGKAHAIINNANGAIAAEVYGHNSKDDSGGADQLANLIAAAPELLAALKPFADLIDHSGIKSDDPDADTFMTRTDALGISTIPILTVGHLRAARAAIGKAEGQF